MQNDYIKQEIDNVENKLDRHIEIYANNGKELAGLKIVVANVVEGIDEIKKLIHNGYVTKVEFKPIRMVVYGMVGFILIGVLSAIIASVVSTNNSENVSRTIQEELSKYEVKIEK